MCQISPFERSDICKIWKYNRRKYTKELFEITNHKFCLEFELDRRDLMGNLIYRKLLCLNRLLSFPTRNFLGSSFVPPKASRRSEICVIIRPRLIAVRLCNEGEAHILSRACASTSLSLSLFLSRGYAFLIV